MRPPIEGVVLWRDVDTDPPPVGNEVLLYTGNMFFVAWLNGETNPSGLPYWSDGERWTAGRGAKWMPLPEAPK